MDFTPKNSFTTLKTITKKRLNGFTMCTILFVLFTLIIGITAGLTYSGFQSQAESSGTLTFAVNGHQGTMNLSNTKITNYNSTDLILTFTLASETNYTSPTISSITMGGVALTKDGNNFKSSSIVVVTYSSNTLTIYRAEVTGNLVITGSSTAQTYTITYNANGGSGTMANSTPSYNSVATLRANNFIRTGYTFAGWANTAGGNVEFGDGARIMNLGNATLYAVWVANGIVFDNQDKSLTYSTTSQTTTITGASNGTGTYSYTIIAGSDNSYFSNSGTTITIGANTPVGVYHLAITATDSGSSKTKTAAITITINVATMNTPSVSVSTAGVVTWGAITGATRYDISIDNSNWTQNVSSGYNFNSVITANTGSRTVYVRAIASSNYDANKTGSRSVNVYSVTLSSGTGISGVSGAGRYISGATVTLGATVSSGYTWSRWTQTSGGVQVSTTQAYSATITSNWAYTANAVSAHKTVRIRVNNESSTSNWKEHVYYEVSNSTSYKTDLGQIETTICVENTTSGDIMISNNQYLYIYVYWYNVYEEIDEGAYMTYVQETAQCTSIVGSGLEYLTKVGDEGYFSGAYKIYRLTYSNATDNQTYVFNFEYDYDAWSD